MLSSCIIIWLTEHFKNKKKYILAYLILQFISIFLYNLSSILYRYSFFNSSLLYNLSNVLNSDTFLAISISLQNTEGGLIWIILSFVFYYAYNNKFRLTVLYIFYCFLFFLLIQFEIIARIILKIGKIDISIAHFFHSLVNLFIGITPFYSGNISMLYDNYQWMMVFSLPFILLYNRKKGINLKYLFYIFYPVHMIILYLIGNILYNM